MNTQTSSSSSSGGIGFIGVLTAAFIILKLVGIISWSWFWVLSPMIFSVGLVIAFLIFMLILLLVD